MVPSPGVHADLPAPTTLASADDDAPADGIKVALSERQSLVDPQSCAPEQDDESTGTQSRCSVAGASHHRDDLFDGGRIGRVVAALVARRAAIVKAGHGRRRPAATSGIEKL